MHQVYFIGGASGSGKTAIQDNLQKSLGENIQVYDFDDIGVPAHADKKWRQEITERWMQRILKEENDVCLLGQIVLGEILATPSANKLGKVHYLLMDVSDIERIQRLRQRDTYGATQDMLNWAAWLRMHHHEPQWAQHVLKQGAWEGLSFSRWDELHDWATLAHVEFLDTSSMHITKVTQKVVEWIKQVT